MRAWDARLAAENGKLAQADAASRNAGIKMNEAMGESQAKAAKMQNEASKALEVAERARGQWEAFARAFDGAPRLAGMLRPEMAFLNVALATPDAAALRKFADEEFCPMARMESGQLRELPRPHQLRRRRQEGLFG